MRIVLSAIFLMFLLTSCAIKEPLISSSATILIKTPTMKFYDKGFISKYPYYTHVQIFQAGQTILDLKVYDDRVCETTFRCQDLKRFNQAFLHKSYKKDFLKELLDREDKNIIFRDKDNRVLIKIKKD